MAILTAERKKRRVPSWLPWIAALALIPLLILPITMIVPIRAPIGSGEFHAGVWESPPRPGSTGWAPRPGLRFSQLLGGPQVLSLRIGNWVYSVDWVPNS
jgi:hypothetical protein